MSEATPQAPAKRSRWRRADGERGAVFILTAIAMPILIVATSFAIDLGAQRSLRRNMQAKADVIALDLSRHIDGSNAYTLLHSATITEAIKDSALDNDFDDHAEIVDGRKKVEVTWGRIDAVTKRFVPTSTLQDSPEVVTAVQVQATDVMDRVFALGESQASRIAVAAADGIAGFQIGSKLASVDTQRSAFLNGLFNRVLGGSLNISALTYQGLVGKTVNLGDLSSELGLASPTQLASANVNARSFYLAMARVLQHQGDTAAAGVLNTIALQTNQTLTIPVGSLMSIDAGGEQAALTGGVDVFNVLTGSVYAINGSSAITIPNLNLNIAGLASTSVTLEVVQRPQIKFGRVGAQITTQQVKVSLTPQLNVPLTVAGLLGVNLRGAIPLTTSVAGATGRIRAIDCSTTPKRLSLGVDPQPVAVVTGLDLDLFANVLGIPVRIAEVDVAANATPSGSSNGGFFDHTAGFLPPVGSGSMLAAPATSLGLSGLLQVSNANVTVLGVLPLNLSVLNPVINAALNPILSALDTLVTGPLAQALGLELAGADIGAIDMSCSAPTLVQ